MRSSDIRRKTAETDITLSLVLDGSGKSDINTGCGFLDHMLTLFSAHGCFDLNLSCSGDTNVDFHHTAEDIGICLGQAFCSSLGDKSGIRRYGHSVIPMDEALVLCAADLSGRSVLSWDVSIPAQKIGDFDSELVKEFWLAFVRASAVTLHVRQLSGENSHHIAECVFKATARCLRDAAETDPAYLGRVPSTKGVL